MRAAETQRPRRGRSRRNIRRPSLRRLLLEVLEDRRLLTSYTLTTLASFNGTDGLRPTAGMVLDGQGNLYGTTYAGGTNSPEAPGADGSGTVFEIAKGSNKVANLALFNGNNGWGPSGLVLDGQGNLYGTTYGGGAKDNGTVFKVAVASDTLATLASFSTYLEGSGPNGVVLDGQGNLYGTAFYSGIGYGTVFEVASGSNTVTPLASFNSTTGAYPGSTLAFDGQGNLYGTTVFGGSAYAGTVFQFATASNTITTIASFSGDPLNSFDHINGSSYPSGVVLDSQGNLYGATRNGGPNDAGTVFEIANGSNTITTLASFNYTNGQSPGANLVMDGQGNLYGTTGSGGAGGYGTVFEIAKGSNTVTTLTTFNGTNGSGPNGLVLDGQGNLYGTTYGGGASGDGTVFELKPINNIQVTAPSFLSDGSVAYGYQINGTLPQATTIEVEWASGTTVNTIIGSPIMTTTTGTVQGTYSLTATQSQFGMPPAGAQDLLFVVDPNNVISPADPSKVAALPLPDIAALTPSFNTTDGGIEFGYTISNANLPLPTTAALYWSPVSIFAPSYLANYTLAYSTPTKTADSATPYTIHVDPAKLTVPPTGTEYLLAVMDLPDVQNPNGLIIESDKTNNTAFTPIQFIVASLGNDAQGTQYGSLREMINEVNGNPTSYGPDAITFASNISGGTISLQNPLSALTRDHVSITGPITLNDGLAAGDGLDIWGGQDSVQGLTIAFFSGAGISIASNNDAITGNQIIGNQTGILVSSGASGDTIGGRATGMGNLITGNQGDGIDLNGVQGTLIQGNWIGTDSSGNTGRGNGGDGINVFGGATGNTIGGTNPGAGNTIADNSGNGVTIGHRANDASTGDAVLENAIYGNAKLGIDLGNDGVTVNNSEGHAGPNLSQDFPVLASASDLNGTSTIAGSIVGAPDTTYHVEFFSDPAVDPSGYGQGQIVLAYAIITTDSTGNASFSLPMPKFVPAGQIVTATATDPAGNTSEFAADIVVDAKIVVDSVQTYDSRELIVNYDIRTATLDRTFVIGVYRSDQPQYNPNDRNNVEVADYQVTGDGLKEGSQTITIDPTSGDWGMNASTLTAPLVPDPALPYLLAVADPNNQLPSDVGKDSTQGHFQIYTIAAVTHGQETSNDAPNSAPWVLDMASELMADGYNKVIPLYWNSFLPAPGQAFAGGVNMYNKIVAAATALAATGLQPNDIIDVLLIGHSRGSAVIGTAMQFLVNLPPNIPQLQHGYYEMTFLDPHPANPDTIDDVSMAGLSVFSEAFTNVFFNIVAQLAFDYASHSADDPSITVPPRVNQVLDYYQTNSNFGLSIPALEQSPLEGVFNLWGVPGQITIVSPAMTPSSTIDISSLGVGHSEVVSWYLTNLAVLTNGSPPPDPLPPWPAQNSPNNSPPPDTGSGPDQLLVFPASLDEATGSANDLYVVAVNSAGNPDPSFDGSVSIALQDGNGGVLGGTLTANAVDGFAEFTDVSFETPGDGYVLQASSDGVESGSSPPLDVFTDQLVITTGPPSNDSVGSSCSIVVNAEDGAGNLDPSFNGEVTVTLADPLGDSPGTTVTLNAVDGTASGTVTFTQPGELILTVKSDGVAEGFDQVSAGSVSTLPAPSFSNLNAPVITYGTASTTISGQLQVSAGGPTIPAGETVQVALNGVLQNAVLASDGSFSTSFDTGSLGVVGSPDTISFSYAGDADFDGVTASSTLTVQPATPSLNVTDAGGTYNGAPFPAVATVAGVVTDVDNTPAPSLEGVTPNVTYYAGSMASGPPLPEPPTFAGTYAVVANFAGSTDYTGTSAQATFTIAPAPLTITSVSAVTPNPRNTAVSNINVTFSEPIITSSLTAGALTLTDDGGSNLITGAVTLTLVSGSTYQIGGLAGLTTAQGEYTLTVNAADLQNSIGGAGAGLLSASWLMDTTAPTSHVANTLGTSQTSDSFPVSVTFSDPAGPGGAPASGVVSVSLYDSVNNGPFTFYQSQTITASTSGTLTFTFIGQDRNLYAFHSVAQDAAGNVESKSGNAIEASTSVPDLNPPLTHILTSSPSYSWGPFPSSEFSGLAPSSYSNGIFSLNWAGADPDQNSGTPAGSIALVNVYVVVDGGSLTLVGQNNAGTPNTSDVYSGSITYDALADGQSHTYSFYSVGIDDEQKTQATPSSPDLTLTETYTAPLSVNNLVVEKGIAERSFIQYLDVDFNQTLTANAELQALKTGLAGSTASSYVQLVWFGEGLNGGSTSKGSVNLFGKGTSATVSLTGNDLSINFGSNGITSLLTETGVSGTGRPTSTFGDGWYALGINPTGGATSGPVFFETFFRLLGSATGDLTVTGSYTASGTDAYTVYHAEGESGPLLNADVNGDGSVNTKDLSSTAAADGRSVGATQPQETNFPQFHLFAGASTAAPGHVLAMTQAQVEDLLPAAIAAWQAAGLDAADVRALQNVPISISNLGTTILGQEDASGITINQTAAGYKWWTGAAGNPSANEVDLLTVLEHELGHVIGLPDNAKAGDLMEISLGLGARRSPTPADVVSTSRPGTARLNGSVSGATVDQALSSIVGAAAVSAGTPARSIGPVSGPEVATRHRKQDAHPARAYPRRLDALRLNGRGRSLGQSSLVSFARDQRD